MTLDGVEVRPSKPFDDYTPGDIGRMFMAVTEQLGLRLESTTGLFDVLVVDRVDDPARKETLPLAIERTQVIPADSGSLSIPTLSRSSSAMTAIEQSSLQV